MQLIPVELLDIWVHNSIYYLIAPEVMCRLNHSFAVDYFALGVIAYEFMLGRVNLNIYYNFKRDHMLEGRDRK